VDKLKNDFMTTERQLTTYSHRAAAANWQDGDGKVTRPTTVADVSREATGDVRHWRESYLIGEAISVFANSPVRLELR
jgi:hypothetical protein